MGDSLGRLFRVTTWGESHGVGLGVVIDGVPAGMPLDLERVQQELDRRRPGQSKLTTPRKESDRLELLSGLWEGKTTGTALAFFIRNADARSAAYHDLARVYRPSHADFTYQAKYGWRDWRGGGRASARETAARVAAGAVAQQLLTQACGVETVAYVSQIHHLRLPADFDPLGVDRAAVEANPVRCPHEALASAMATQILAARKAGDSLGGVVTAVVKNVPEGLGEPVFDKLTAELAHGLMSLPATRGIEFGLGFAAAAMTASEHNDAMQSDAQGRIQFASNRSGGIQGGISNGEPLLLRVAFKPTATIRRPQQTVTCEGEAVTLSARGRHDPCVLPRAVPLVEAMIHLVLADHLLRAAVRRDVPHLAAHFREHQRRIRQPQRSASETSEV